MKSEKKRNKKLHLMNINLVTFIYFCVFTVVLLLLVYLVFYIVVSTSLESQTRSRVVNVGKVVASQTQRANVAILRQEFRHYREEGLAIYIFSADGEVIVPSDENLISNSRVEEAFDRASAEGASYRSGELMNYCVNVTFDNQTCVLLVSCPLAVLRDVVKNMQRYLLIISAIALIVAFIIAYVISQRLTRGLKTISERAVQMAKGDYSVQFVNADYSEVAQLSDTLNYVRDEVKKSHDFQREILANVTHDLKTPLTMIKAYASMVQEISGDNPEKRNEHLQVIIDETDRLTGLVNDVLLVSKVNSNLDEINFKVFNLTEVLYGIINKFGYLQESGYNIMVDVDPDIYTRADEEKIEQVIYNFLGNAVSYTGEDKTVFVSLKKSMDGNRVKLSVRDTGNGISKEDLPNIWDRYFRSDENHVRPVKGTGLGLNIVKVILQNHSFDFGVESKKGEGATFWVDFPGVPSEE